MRANKAAEKEKIKRAVMKLVADNKIRHNCLGDVVA